MTRLTAETKTIGEVFRREYVIPNYQRRYSWDKDECQQLMDDLLLFYENQEGSEQYFLGCLVIAEENDHWSVIDGQQRLTTLSLLIKALFNRDQTNLGLARMLKKVDPVSDAVSEELRLESRVWGKDKENLDRVLLDKGVLVNPGQPGNRFDDNLECIGEALNKNLDIKRGGAGLRKFIQMLQSRVVLLPIECDSADGALTIFRTLNDRGLPLNDSDIFKASMYDKLVSEEDKGWFVGNWNELGEDGNGDLGDFVERLFRIHLHVLRADAQETGKEGKLRDYFDDQYGRLAEPRKVVAQLQKYRAIFGDWGTPDINIWWHILASTPNLYWEYPLFVFLNKHGKHGDGEFSLPEEKVEEFITLMKDTARYFFIKGVATNSVNTVKDTVFRVCSAIRHGKDRGEDYATIYRKNAIGNIPFFDQKLNDGDCGRYQKGLVLTNSALFCTSPEEAKGYSDLLVRGKYQIEHILPQKWSHYDGWDDETHANCIGKLGNLIPFERRLNIRASNEFFARKQKEYAMSTSAEVRGLCNIPKWTLDELGKRHTEVIIRLREFFQY